MLQVYLVDESFNEIVIHTQYTLIYLLKRKQYKPHSLITMVKFPIEHIQYISNST